MCPNFHTELQQLLTKVSRKQSTRQLLLACRPHRCHDRLLRNPIPPPLHRRVQNRSSSKSRLVCYQRQRISFVLLKVSNSKTTTVFIKPYKQSLKKYQYIPVQKFNYLGIIEEDAESPVKNPHST